MKLKMQMPRAGARGAWPGRRPTPARSPPGSLQGRRCWPSRSSAGTNLPGRAVPAQLTLQALHNPGGWFPRCLPFNFKPQPLRAPLAPSGHQLATGAPLAPSGHQLATEGSWTARTWWSARACRGSGCSGHPRSGSCSRRRSPCAPTSGSTDCFRGDLSKNLIAFTAGLVIRFKLYHSTFFERKQSF